MSPLKKLFSTLKQSDTMNKEFYNNLIELFESNGERELLRGLFSNSIGLPAFNLDQNCYVFNNLTKEQEKTVTRLNKAGLPYFRLEENPPVALISATDVKAVKGFLSKIEIYKTEFSLYFQTRLTASSMKPDGKIEFRITPGAQADLLQSLEDELKIEKLTPNVMGHSISIENFIKLVEVIQTRKKVLTDLTELAPKLFGGALLSFKESLLNPGKILIELSPENAENAETGAILKNIQIAFYKMINPNKLEDDAIQIPAELSFFDINAIYKRGKQSIELCEILNKQLGEKRATPCFHKPLGNAGLKYAPHIVTIDIGTLADEKTFNYTIAMNKLLAQLGLTDAKGEKKTVNDFGKNWVLNLNSHHSYKGISGIVHSQDQVNLMLNYFNQRQTTVNYIQFMAAKLGLSNFKINLLEQNLDSIASFDEFILNGCPSCYKIKNDSKITMDALKNLERNLENDYARFKSVELEIKIESEDEGEDADALEAGVSFNAETGHIFVGGNVERASRVLKSFSTEVKDLLNGKDLNLLTVSESGKCLGVTNNVLAAFFLDNQLSFDTNQIREKIVSIQQFTEKQNWFKNLPSNQQNNILNFFTRVPQHLDPKPELMKTAWAYYGQFLFLMDKSETEKNKNSALSEFNGAFACEESIPERMKTVLTLLKRGTVFSDPYLEQRDALIEQFSIEIKSIWPNLYIYSGIEVHFKPFLANFFKNHMDFQSSYESTTDEYSMLTNAKYYLTFGKKVGEQITPPTWNENEPRITDKDLIAEFKKMVEKYYDKPRLENILLKMLPVVRELMSEESLSVEQIKRLDNEIFDALQMNAEQKEKYRVLTDGFTVTRLHPRLFLDLPYLISSYLLNLGYLN